MEEPSLVYHTFFKEFRGSSATEVIQRVYEDSREGTGCNFQQWWDYQKKLWGDKYSHAIPDSSEVVNASQQLLEVLLQVGAVESGPIAL